MAGVRFDGLAVTTNINGLLGVAESTNTLIPGNKFTYSNDSTLGGITPSDAVVSTEKAVSTAISNKQDKLLVSANSFVANNTGVAGSPAYLSVSDSKTLLGAGAANGLATLDALSKIPLTQIPEAVLGALNYQGVWDASTGVYPTATTKGYYWVVSVAGTIDGQEYGIGDWIVNNGVSRDKIDNTDTWYLSGGDLLTVGGSKNINLGSAGLKDTNVTTAIKLGDASNLSLSTVNKTLVGGQNELFQLLKNNSNGVVTLPSITDNGNGSVTIGTNGVVNFYTTAVSSAGTLVRLPMPTGATFTLTDGATNYIYADYNAGSPIYLATIGSVGAATDGRKIPCFRIYRDGNELHTLDYDQYGTALSEKAYFKDISLRGFERQSGLVLSTSGTRISDVSAGVAWFGVTPYSLAQNTSGTAGQLFEYYPVAGVWTKAVVTSYDSAYYSDGTNRIALTASRYVAKYFYRGVETDNHVYYVHGNQYTSASLALAEANPPIPAAISSHSLYVGKIVIQNGATIGTAYPRQWDSAVSVGGVTSHEDLTNINQAGTGILNGHISDGDQAIYGAKVFVGASALGVKATSTGAPLLFTSAGTTAANSVTVNASAQGTARILTIPILNGNADLVHTNGEQAITKWIKSCNFMSLLTSTTSTGGTTPLAMTSNQKQLTTGTLNHIYTLPAVGPGTGGAVGQSYQFINRSTGTVTVNAFGDTNVTTVSSGNMSIVTCTSAATNAGTWDVVSVASGSGAQRMTLETTATAAGTTNLAPTSAQIQVFTGTLTQNVSLPDPTTLPIGYQFVILNESLQTILVNANGATPFLSDVVPNGCATFTYRAVSSTKGLWHVDYSMPGEVGNTIGNCYVVDGNGVVKTIVVTTAYPKAIVVYDYTATDFVISSVKLPDATTLSTGARYLVAANGFAFVNVIDSSSGALGSVSANVGYKMFTLTDNSTIAGVWTVNDFSASSYKTLIDFYDSRYMKRLNGTMYGTLFVTDYATTNNGFNILGAAAGLGWTPQKGKIYMPNANAANRAYNLPVVTQDVDLLHTQGGQTVVGDFGVRNITIGNNSISSSTSNISLGVSKGVVLASEYSGCLLPASLPAAMPAAWQANSHLGKLTFRFKVTSVNPTVDIAVFTPMDNTSYQLITKSVQAADTYPGAAGGCIVHHAYFFKRNGALGTGAAATISNLGSNVGTPVIVASGNDFIIKWTFTNRTVIIHGEMEIMATPDHSSA